LNKSSRAGVTCLEFDAQFMIGVNLLVIVAHALYNFAALPWLNERRLLEQFSGRGK
jgi:hypothetical protein